MSYPKKGITVEQIISTARQAIGTRWIHQGRDIVTGLDCIGLLIWTGKQVQYLDPSFDYLEYYTEPDPVVLLGEMRDKMDEIAVSDLTFGDIPVIRLAGDKYPRHIGILASNLYEMTIIHALHDKSRSQVLEEPFRRWIPFVTHGFRFRLI